MPKFQIRKRTLVEKNRPNWKLKWKNNMKFNYQILLNLFQLKN